MKFDIIACPSRQMHLHCPHQILKRLLCKGKVDYLDLKKELIERWGSKFSEIEFDRAWIEISSRFPDEVAVPQVTSGQGALVGATA